MDKTERLTLKIFNISDNKIEDIMCNAKKLSDNKISFKYQTKYIDTKLDILYSDEITKKIADDTTRYIISELNDKIYCQEDKSLEEVLFERLNIDRYCLGVGESFTAGRISSAIISVPDASKIFNEGIVAYSNDAKMQRLFVNSETLSDFGAVSKETAYEMAIGLLQNKKTDFVIATTGIAGPKSDNTNKPVGLAYIAVGTREGIHVHKLNFSGNREEITEQGKNTALFLAINQIKNY